MSIKTYNYDELEKLARKISKIRNPKNLEKIRDIIINNNPNLTVTENSNGVFMCFNNLSNNTYVLLENFIRNINLQSSISSIENLNSSISESLNNQISINNNFDNTAIKLSNKEKNILKRKMYDDELSTYHKSIEADDSPPAPNKPPLPQQAGGVELIKTSPDNKPSSVFIKKNTNKKKNQKN